VETAASAPIGPGSIAIQADISELAAMEKDQTYAQRYRESGRGSKM
jgi:hypothetical protein